MTSEVISQRKIGLETEVAMNNGMKMNEKKKKGILNELFETGAGRTLETINCVGLVQSARP